MAQEKTNKPCFSNGSEFDQWLQRNCYGCKKDISRQEVWKVFHCSIQSDMMKQCMGYGNEEIRLASWEAAQHLRCPRLVDLKKPPKHRRKKEPGQMKIEF